MFFNYKYESNQEINGHVFSIWGEHLKIKSGPDAFSVESTHNFHHSVLKKDVGVSVLQERIFRRNDVFMIPSFSVVKFANHFFVPHEVPSISWGPLSHGHTKNVANSHCQPMPNF